MLTPGMNVNPLDYLVSLLSLGRRRLSPTEYRYARWSFAQNGEDVFLLSQYADPSYAGFFVDVGAHDPIRFSNTALLSKRGWRGINIDPVPHVIRRFRKVRPRDINLELAISDRSGEQELMLYREPAFNGLRGWGWSASDRADSPESIGSIKVRTARLDEVLGEHCPANQVIDVLSVDCEGHDEVVLASNDWNRFRPWFVLVEDFRDDQESTILQSMQAHGYRSVTRLGWTRVFKRIA